MPRAKSKPTAHNWAVELRSVLLAKTREPKGEGWMTTKEFASALAISVNTARRYLRNGLASGVLEKFSGTAIFKNQIKTQTWHRPTKIK